MLWNFFGTRHGKGPHDNVGAVLMTHPQTPQETKGGFQSETTKEEKSWGMLSNS